MGDLTSMLLYIGVLLLLAKLAEEGFRRAGLIPFAGSILVGMVLGPGILGIVQVDPVISFTTSLGIVFILFLAGAEEFVLPRGLSRSPLAAALWQVALPSLAIFAALTYYGVPDALLLSVPLAMTSVGPLSSLLDSLGMAKSSLGSRMFYTSALSEIISIVLFAFLTQRGRPFVALLELGAVIAAIFAFGSSLSRLLERAEVHFKVREVEFAMVIAVILIVGYFSQAYGFNSALAALFLGLLLRGYMRDRPELLSRLHGFTYGFFAPLFFAGIGLYLVRIDAHIALAGIALFAAVVALKFAAGAISSKLMGIRPALGGFGMSTKGGVDASLLIAALSAGLISPSSYSIAAIALTLSALSIPLMFGRMAGRRPVGYRGIRLSDRLLSLPNIAPIYSSCSDSLRSVVDKITERNARAIVVVDDEMRPVGYISVQTLLEVDPAKYEVLDACSAELEDIEVMDADSRIADVLRKFRETEGPVIAIVDREGRLVATVYERELLRAMVGLRPA